MHSMKRQGIHIFNRPLGLVLITVYKVLWGFVECCLGLLAIWSASLVFGELAEDPQDIFVNFVLHHTAYSTGSAIHVGVLFFLLGFTKLAIAYGLWYRSWKIRRTLIIFLSIVTVFTLFDFAIHWTFFKAFALLADFLVLYYLWRILPHHLKDHDVGLVPEVTTQT